MPRRGRRWPGWRCEGKREGERGRGRGGRRKVGELCERTGKWGLDQSSILRCLRSLFWLSVGSRRGSVSKKSSRGSEGIEKRDAGGRKGSPKEGNCSHDAPPSLRLFLARAENATTLNCFCSSVRRAYLTTAVRSLRAIGLKGAVARAAGLERIKMQSRGRREG